MAIAAGVLLIDSSRVFPGLWVLLPVAGTALLIVSGREGVGEPSVAFATGRRLHRPDQLSALFVALAAAVVCADFEGGVPSPSDPARIAGAQRRARVGDLPTDRAADPIRVRGRTAVPALAVAMTMVCARRHRHRCVRRPDRAPVNRSDAAHLVDFYERMRKTGIAEAYRRECDFMDWADRAHARLDRSVVHRRRPTRYRACFGEIRLPRRCRWESATACPPTASLAQVTTSACKAVDRQLRSDRAGRRCEKANRYAMESIGRLRPALVILAQSGDHAATDWEAFARRVLALGAAHVLVVGPNPVWRPSLPRIYAEHHMQDQADYVGTGLDTDVFDVDRAVRLCALAAALHVTYAVIARSTLS